MTYYAEAQLMIKLVTELNRMKRILLLQKKSKLPQHGSKFQICLSVGKWGKNNAR